MPLSNLLLSVHPHNSDKKVLMVFLDIHSHYTEGEGVMEITASKVQRGRGWWCRLKIYIFSFFTNFILSEIQAQKLNFAVMKWMWPKEHQHSWSHRNEVQMAGILQQQSYKIR